MTTRDAMPNEPRRDEFQAAARSFYSAAVELLERWQTEDWDADEDETAYGTYPPCLPSFDEFVAQLGGFVK